MLTKDGESHPFKKSFEMRKEMGILISDFCQKSVHSLLVRFVFVYRL